MWTYVPLQRCLLQKNRRLWFTWYGVPCWFHSHLQWLSNAIYLRKASSTDHLLLLQNLGCLLTAGTFSHLPLTFEGSTSALHGQSTFNTYILNIFSEMFSQSTDTFLNLCYSAYLTFGVYLRQYVFHLITFWKYYFRFRNVNDDGVWCFTFNLFWTSDKYLG